MPFWNTDKSEKLPKMRPGYKKTRMFSALFVVSVLLVSLLYLCSAWNRNQDEAKAEAILLAHSIESLLHPEHIVGLTASEEDLNNPEYSITKHGLERLIRSADSIHFAYLLREKEGQIVVLVDSESSDQPKHYSPGQRYIGQDDFDWGPFHAKKTVLADRRTDRWGSWISVFVPVVDPRDATVIAVLGLDFKSSEWYQRLWRHIVPNLIYNLVFLLLFSIFLWFHSQRRKWAAGSAIYRSIFEQAPAGVAIMLDDTILPPSNMMPITTNPMYEQILGRTSADLAHITWAELTHPDDLQADRKKYEQFKSGEITGYSMEKRYLRPDGSTVWTNMKIAPLFENLDNQSLHLCLLEDISFRKEAEDALRESEREKSILLSNLPGMAFRCINDQDWTMLFASNGCLGLTGYASEDLTFNRNISYNALILPKYRDRLRKEWNRILGKRLPFVYEYEIMTKAGERKWVLEMGEGVYDDSGQVEVLEGIILDISERKLMEESLKFNNEHDMLTGLYNRQFFANLIDTDTRLEPTRKRALVGMNFNAVSSLSMTYGFQYSQQLIKKIGEVLKTICTDTTQLFQTYVDRFAFYVMDYSDKAELMAFCQIISKKLEPLISAERISNSISIVEIEASTQKNASQLFKNLLITSEMVIGLPEKDSEICFFNSDMEASIIRKETLKRELAEIAVDENPERLFLQFQPILDLASNRICGFEALARLKSDSFGIVSPLEFIPLAEETKLIIPLGKKIIRHAFHLLGIIEEKGLGPIEVSINISAIQLLRKDFIESLFEIIHEMQVHPSHICLEITESLLVSNYLEICKITEMLRSRGLKIAIDDFGTGYSSLARIREVASNYIKIDKYFIDKLLVLTPEQAITEDVISMAHKLGSCVIAEGVEHEQQLHYLKEHGCDRVQGFLIARSLDLEAVIEMLEDQTRAGNSGAVHGDKKKGWW